MCDVFYCLKFHRKRTGGRKRADECGVTFRENTLTVPNAPLKKEIAKPRPIAPGAHLIALP
jgi:hypothetical protein